jgi:RND family efflux transporter MFP subunit
MPANGRPYALSAVACVVLLGASGATRAAAGPPKSRELFACNGTVRSARSVHLVPAVAGWVSKVHVDIGDSVTAGQVLAELDPGQAKLESDLSQAKLEVARARLQQLRAGLAEKERGQSPGKERLAVAEAEVHLAEAELRLARRKLEDHQIRVPFGGAIVSRLIDVGQYVSPQPAPGVAADLFQLQSPVMVLILDVPEARVGEVFKGQVCRIECPVFPGVVFPGRVEFVSPAIDPDTRSFKAVVAIQPREGTGGLRPGLHAKAGFLAKE